MDLNTLTTMLLDFVRAHQGWAPLIAGALAFAESLAVVSLLVPSTVLLLGIGALIGASVLADMAWSSCRRNPRRLAVLCHRLSVQACRVSSPASLVPPASQ
jgi:hypothetical protein